MKRISFFILMPIILVYFTGIAQGVYENLGDRDSLIEEICTNPIDTVGMVAMFLVDGVNPCGCRYADSCDFRYIRKEMPSWAWDLFDTTNTLSMTNFFKSTSNGKHLIRGIVLPAGDSAYQCYDWPVHPPHSYRAPNDLQLIVNQADPDVDFGQYDLTGAVNGGPDGYVDFASFIAVIKDFLKKFQ